LSLYRPLIVQTLADSLEDPPRILEEQNVVYIPLHFLGLNIKMKKNLVYLGLMSEIRVVFGEESFSVEEHVDGLLKHFPSSDRETFEGTFELEAVIQSLSTSSLFASNKIVILKNPWFFSKAPSDAQLKVFAQLLEAAEASEFPCLIYQLGSVDQRKKAVNQLKKKSKFHVYNPFKDWEQDKVLDWIKSRAQQCGKAMDHDAALALEEIGGTNLRQLAGELEKCAVYVGNATTITRADISALCAPATTSIFEFNEAMKKRQASTCLKALHRLLSHGEDPIRLSGLIVSNLRLYTQLLALSQSGKSVNDIAKEIGKNAFFLKNVLPDIKRNYSLDDLKNAYRQFADCDYAIKSGKMKPEVAVKLTLSSIL